MDWAHIAEQKKEGLATTHREMEERARQKISQAVQAAQQQVQMTIADAKAELQQQIEEGQSTLHNLRQRLSHVELELSNSQDQADVLAKKKQLMKEKVRKLEVQNTEDQARCKALAETATPMGQPATLDMANIQQEKLALEHAQANFEVNKSGWIQNAAYTIATIAYRILRNSEQATEPPQHFLDRCMDEAIAALDKEQ